MPPCRGFFFFRLLNELVLIKRSNAKILWQIYLHCYNRCVIKHQEKKMIGEIVCVNICECVCLDVYIYKL